VIELFRFKIFYLKTLDLYCTITVYYVVNPMEKLTDHRLPSYIFDTHLLIINLTCAFKYSNHLLIKIFNENVAVFMGWTEMQGFYIKQSNLQNCLGL